MNCIDFFDRGWSIHPDGPCTIHAETGAIHSYELVRSLTFRLANAMRKRGYEIGAKAAVLSANDPLGFAVVLSIMRAGLGLGLIKQLVAESLERGIEEALRLELRTNVDYCLSYDMQEGISAFAERRKPQFLGR